MSARVSKTCFDKRKRMFENIRLRLKEDVDAAARGFSQTPKAHCQIHPPRVIIEATRSDHRPKHHDNPFFVKEIR